jgi:hypothetical protein
MTEWTRISRNPVSPAVHDHLKATLASKRAGNARDYMAFLQGFVTDRTVLDIGMVEHDLGHVESPHWKHRLVRDWARRVRGVDILEEEVRFLSAQGYDVVACDATSDTDLGERFERVVVGDVLEHVDRPVDLLRFAARHTAPEGRIAMRTPNPFWVGHVLRQMREETFISNAEHVAWISPSMALELGRRAGLELEAYWVLEPFGSTPSKRVLDGLRRALFGRSELFSAAFIYVFRHPASAEA